MKLKHIVENPYLNLVAGLILLLSSGYEIWETIEDPTLGSHHGIIIYALFQIIKCIPEILEGVHHIDKAKKS